MAASFIVVSQDPETQVFGDNTVAEMMRVGFVTKPSGVAGSRLVPRQAWNEQGTAAWIQPLAESIENLISGGLASYATYVQIVEPNTGLIADAFEFVVTYDPGDGRPLQQATTTVPITALTADTGFGGVLNTYFGGGGSALDPAQALRDTYDDLVATANL